MPIPPWFIDAPMPLAFTVCTALLPVIEAIAWLPLTVSGLPVVALFAIVIPAVTSDTVALPPPPAMNCEFTSCARPLTGEAVAPLASTVAIRLASWLDDAPVWPRPDRVAA